MISGANSSEKEFIEELEQFGGDSGARSTDSVIDKLEERRKNAMRGGVNCIPFPFERFRSEIPGIEQEQYVIITASTKVGKCFGKGTRVRMADNTIKNIEDIQVGDWVMSPDDEKPKQVLSVNSGREQLYRIHSETHDDLIVNESHIMYLYKPKRTHRNARYFTETIGNLIEKQRTVKTFKKEYLAVASDECDFGFDISLPIEPYFYGLWLGDGATQGCDITTADPEVVEYLRQYADRLGMKVSEYTHKSCGRYNICRKSHKDKLGFEKRLVVVTGKQKEHINRDYLNASVQERYELLAGLIDSDGYLNHAGTGYKITMKYLSCIKDIQELARSLGLSAHVNKKYNSKLDRYYYILSLYGKNCTKIPVKIPRKKCRLTCKDSHHFSFSIEPIGEGDYYGLTLGGNHLFLLEDYTVVHNSQLANYLYLYNVLDYCFLHPEKCSCHIIYFALEESVQRVIERYMSHLLWKLDGKRFAPADLRSTSVDYPVPKEIIDLLKSEKYQERFRFFEKCVQFDTENTNPTGILRTCEEYAKAVGTYKSNTITSHSDWTKEVEVFDDYIQDDPNHYKICIIDHISLVDKEQGFGKKETIDKVSEYFVKYLRNRYKYTCVVIQQQSAEAEGLEAMKQKRIVPSNATGGDSKYTFRDCNIALGLFDPSRLGLSTYKGYDIADGLKSYGRFMNVIANRDGEMGGICPLFFDGAVCNFEELPRPDDVSEIRKYYDKVNDLKSWKQQKKLQQLSLFNFFK
jgi:hypothetical protein